MCSNRYGNLLRGYLLCYCSNWHLLCDSSDRNLLRIGFNRNLLCDCCNGDLSNSSYRYFLCNSRHRNMSYS
uniref:Uncharacterized protein n=1 Tax=Octopus bimaculoides TaxID=37653 RepID=A0A0L8G5I3_OCTBM